MGTLFDCARGAGGQPPLQAMSALAGPWARSDGQTALRRTRCDLPIPVEEISSPGPPVPQGSRQD